MPIVPSRIALGKYGNDILNSESKMFMDQTPTDEEIIQAYLHYETTRDRAYDWSWERLYEFANHDPDHAWEIIRKLTRQAPTKFILCNIGAGCLEDLLGYHGDYVIDRVEKEARTNKQFKLALSCVWQNNMSDALFARVLKASGRKSVADSP